VRTRPVKYLFIVVLRDEAKGRREWGKHASHWATIQRSSTSVPAYICLFLYLWYGLFHFDSIICHMKSVVKSLRG
jgi:hypothetical protein